MTKRRPQSLDDGLDARTLPANLDAERSVLGVILIDNAAFATAVQLLRAEDFYRDAHRRIFAAMTRLIDERHGLADFVTMKEELGRVGDLDEIGGPVYLSSLADGVPRATNVRYYARIVHEKAQLRALIFAANKTLQDAYAGELLADDLVSEADQRFLSIAAGSDMVLRDVGEGVAALADAIDYRTEHRGELLGVATGFPSLDDLTMGWQAGDLTIVAARPSVGKTTFALNTGVHVARSQRRVAMFSLEMRQQQLHYRILSSLSGVDLQRLKAGQLGSIDHSRIARAIELMHDLPFAITDRAGQRFEDIRAAARRQKTEKGLDLLIVDYVQLMPGSLGPKANRNEQVTDISRRMKVLADEVQCPVLLVSQLSRANDKRADPRPRLSDLRESGALEQDADNVLFLHRETHRVGGITECILEKQRNGPTGTIHLGLDRATLTFSDAGPEPDVVEEPVQNRRATR